MALWIGSIAEASRPSLADILLEKLRAWTGNWASGAQDCLPDDARRQLTAEANEVSLTRTWQAHSAKRVF